MKRTAIQLLFALLMLLPILSMAHRPDRSLIYLRIYETQGIEGRFEICVDELNEFINLDLADDAEIEDVKPYEKAIHEYILRNSSFASVAGEHPIKFTGEISKLVVEFGTFFRFHFELENVETIPDEMDVRFNVFLDEDKGHTNALGIEYNWKAGMLNNESIIALVFRQGDSQQKLDLTDASIWKGFWAMIKQGIWHIWIGIDHILLLLALILPSVVRRSKDPDLVLLNESHAGTKNWGWWPVRKFKPAFWYIVKVITFFTIAHTITLTLASLEIINLPSRLVESVIAASIGLAAFHNIKPIFKGRDWIIAFGFGLFHGFGFATVLGELGLTGEYLTLSLLGFNIGVEIGQVAIIALIFPILYIIRKGKQYPRLLVYISILLIAISLYWLVERAFDVDFILDEKIRRAGGDILRWLNLR